MQVTEVQYTPNPIPPTPGKPRLVGFVDVVFDDAFVVRGLKIVDSASGRIVSFPAKKDHTHCLSCAQKVEIHDRYCRWCGRSIEGLTRPTPGNRPYHEVAHPINAPTRAHIINAIFAHLDGIEQQRIAS